MLSKNAIILMLVYWLVALTSKLEVCLGENVRVPITNGPTQISRVFETFLVIFRCFWS